MSEPPFDMPRVQRWFAIEFNNQAWDLVERTDRSAEESQRMIHLAHAAMVHWQAIGQPINRLRGECLLASVYLAADRFESAALHSEQALAFSAQGIADETPFDVASLYACAVRVYERQGNSDQVTKLRPMADAAIEKLTEADDRALVQKLYG